MALAKRFIKRLRPVEVDDMRVWIIKVAQHFNLGTQCSGTDSPIMAWRAFETAVTEELGIPFSAHHCYACEKDKQKREFLRRLWPRVKIFCDVNDLATDEAINHEGHEAEVPPVNFAVAGFPCTTTSPWTRTRRALPAGAACRMAQGPLAQFSA